MCLWWIWIFKFFLCRGFVFLWLNSFSHFALSLSLSPSLVRFNSIISLISVVLQQKLPTTRQFNKNYEKFLVLRVSCRFIRFFFSEFLVDFSLAGHKKSFMRRKLFLFMILFKLQLPSNGPGGNVKQ